MKPSIFEHPEFDARLFYPRADCTPPPDGARDHYVDVDSARIHVREHTAPAAKLALLVFHGNGEVVADYDRSAPQFARAGAALWIADYRGYGESTGEPSFVTAIADAHPIAAYVVAHATPRAVIVLGRSLGAACAHELYARPPAGVAAVVLESAFCDLTGLVQRRGIVPPKRFRADERERFDPVTKLARGSLPLLVLHGAADELVPPADAKSAYAAAGGEAKRLVLVDGHGHNDISLAAAYWDALAALITSIG